MTKEFKPSDFYRFKVDMHFLRALDTFSKHSHTLRTPMDAERSVKRPVWEIPLTPPLAQKYGVESVFVVHFDNENFDCWAGSTIDSEEVFDYIRRIVQ